MDFVEALFFFLFVEFYDLRLPGTLGVPGSALFINVVVVAWCEHVHVPESADENDGDVCVCVHQTNPRLPTKAAVRTWRVLRQPLASSSNSAEHSGQWVISALSHQRFDDRFEYS
jgi:hypothetical protein